jgi:hypothetical protein
MWYTAHGLLLERAHFPFEKREKKKEEKNSNTQLSSGSMRRSFSVFEQCGGAGREKKNKETN